MDSFNPGQRIPCLQLRAKPVRNENIPELLYEINLQGAREPNVMLIEIEPVNEVVSTMEGTYINLVCNSLSSS